MTATDRFRLKIILRTKNENSREGCLYHECSNDALGRNHSALTHQHSIPREKSLTCLRSQTLPYECKELPKTKTYEKLMSRYEYHCPGNMAVRMRQLLLVFTGNLVTVALTAASFLNFSLTSDFVLLL